MQLTIIRQCRCQTDRCETDPLLLDQAPIPIGQLRDYIAYSRAHCHPQLSPEAAEDIIEGYMNMRRVGSSRKARTCLSNCSAAMRACL